MPTPKNFTALNAVGETYQLSGAGLVLVYRFGDQSVARDWLSRKRQASKGSFPRPSAGELNDWALKQSSYGGQSENVADNPFISVATDFETLYSSGEIWVQKILEQAPTLGVFVVPFNTLFRPSPTKSISKMETEWLYYDGDNEIGHYLSAWRANPKRVTVTS